MKGDEEAGGWTEERTSELASADSDEGRSRK